MKKIMFIAILALFFNNAFAQDLPKPDYDELDKKLTNIDTTKIKSGILYERTMQLANLYNFNLSDSSNTANYNYFKQATLELHNASKGKKFLHSMNLEKNVEKFDLQKNKVAFGIINTDFQILSDWENSAYKGVRFDSIKQQYIQIPNKEPFYTLHTTVIAPLKVGVKGEEIEFLFTNEFLFSYEKPIKSLIATFENGTSQAIITNGIFTERIVKIRYATSGLKVINFKIVYQDNETLTTKASIYVVNNNNSFSSCSTSDVLRQDFSLTSNLEFTGYKTTDPKIKAKFDYRVYYSNGNTAKKIMKPIIIVDGFDPGDKGKIEDCDCEQIPECAARNLTNGVFDALKHRSITDIMIYYQNGNIKYLLTELRSKGYDVIIVNFPKYNTTNLLNNQMVAIDGGAYYIESNAFAFMKLLTETKDKLVANGSTSQIAVIAPSMAGQITRYALSYMEKIISRIMLNYG